MAIASFVISVLAFLAAGTAVWYSHRQAVAAEASADADQRAISLAEAEAAKYSPPWVLQWEAGSAYLLTNTGDEPVFDVKIDRGSGANVVDGQLEHERIGPRSAVRFLVFRAFGSEDHPVVVTWRRLPEGRVLDWQHPLPADSKP